MLRLNGAHGLRQCTKHGLVTFMASCAVTPRLISHAKSSPSSPSRIQIRGKKTKTTVNLADLPQGALPPLEPLPEEEGKDEPAYPTVVLQARRNMQKFDNCVLLTRVGGFYELYFEHADEFGPLLNLKVASKKTSAGPVPMVSSAGLPEYHA